MTSFSFTCPAPCHREIKVDAYDNLDAVEKVITAGAICCRNAAYRCNCDQAPFPMSPIPVDELRRIVSLGIHEG